MIPKKCHILIMIFLETKNLKTTNCLLRKNTSKYPND